MGQKELCLVHADTIIAGGAESMSLVPMMGHVVRPNIKLAEKAPEYYMGMGHTAEEVANKFGISRRTKMHLLFRSHQKAAKAITEGKFKDEIVPVDVIIRTVDPNHKLIENKIQFCNGRRCSAEY